MRPLCCEVNPGYVCEACGFRQCQDHWHSWVDKCSKNKKELYHIQNLRCIITKKLLWSDVSSWSNGRSVTYWQVKQHAKPG